MKVVVIGHGAVGSVVMKLLAEHKGIKAVHCLDLKFVEQLKHKKANYHVMNVLDKDKFVKYLEQVGPHVVINLSLPSLNTAIMESCLKAGVNYMDTASFWDVDPDKSAKIPYKFEQMDFDKKFADRGLFGMIGSGVAPGLDNIMVAECASKLDEIDYIKIRMVEDTGSSEIFFSWNKDWLLDELGTKPLMYENGKFKLTESFGGEEEYEFPEPVGKKKTYYFAQDEAGSIPMNIKTKKMDVKIHDNNIEVSKLLVALGLVSSEPVDVKGVKVKPIQMLSKLLPDPVPGEEKKFPNAIFAMAVETIGKKNGKSKSVKMAVVFPNQKQISNMGLGNFISFPTALSVELFTTAIDKITKKGVFSPEVIDEEARKFILGQLEENKVKVVKSGF